MIVVRAALVDCRLTLTPPVARDALASIAWLVNQHLALKEREAVWALLENTRCGKPGALERLWLRLHAAVGAADPAAMADAAGTVLDGPGKLSQELLVRALAARAAGLILTNQGPLAQREMVKYRGRLGNSVATQALFRLLLGHADQGVRSSPIIVPAER